MFSMTFGLHDAKRRHEIVIILACTFLLLPMTATAQKLCHGGKVIWKNGKLVGCQFSSWGTSEENMCAGMTIKKSHPALGSCYVCIQKQYADLSPKHGLKVGVNHEGSVLADFGCLGKTQQRFPVGYTNVTICDCPDGTWVPSLGICVGEKQCTIEGLEQDIGSGRINSFYIESDTFYRVNDGENCRKESGFWSNWLSRDTQFGTGDYETLKDFPEISTPDPVYKCGDMLAIECRSTDGDSWLSAAQNYRCEIAIGGVCRNDSQQSKTQCKDYEIRLFCKWP